MPDSNLKTLSPIDFEGLSPGQKTKLKTALSPFDARESDALLGNQEIYQNET